ncbi:MAG: NuoM family protein [Chloroflexi bacterium]|nr:NuoM family protein [Chloroflexota bacterium]
MDAVLNLAIWLPLAGAILIAVVPGADRAARWIAALVSGTVLVLAVLLLLDFRTAITLAASFVREGILGQPPSSSFPHFVTHIPWIPQLGASYAVGLDGLSLPLFALNALLVFLAVLVSWNTTLRVREYFALLLVLETAVSGVFASLDLLLFFLFWELELAPMFLLIGIWGGARREYAAMKFILYTVSGSALMLLGILLLYLSGPQRTFDLQTLSAQAYPAAMQSIVWLLLFVGFAVKLPVFPLHTWLPDAHTEAPTAISVLLAGILLKMGGYGILRLNLGILPDATQQFSTLIAALAAISIVYGAVVAMMQSDLKRLIANSSVSHMGYVLLGASALTPIALQGAIFQLVSHGLITGLLFVMVGLVYDRTHTREIPALGGLARRMPFIATFFVVAGLASLGLPGMAGFVAEFLVFLGAFPVHAVATVAGVATIVLTAGYLLWTLERVFFGPERSQWERLTDATPLEAVTVGVFVAVIVGLGVYPALLTDIVLPSVSPLAARLAG